MKTSDGKKISAQAARMSADAGLDLVERFFSGTGDSYDFMVNVTTFGGDRRWKRRIVAEIPPGAGRILDLACGTGISTLFIADRYPEAKIVGVELREEYLAVAREKARLQGRGNLDFVLSRAEDYRTDAPFDCIHSSYLAKYADLPVLVKNAHGMLTEGGIFLMHDFSYPANAFLVAVWRLHFWLLQVLGSRLFPSWRDIFYGLPKLIESTRWIEELEAALAANGFKDIRRVILTNYGATLVTARK